MADEENILGGKLSIEDNYSNALMRFANSVLGAENKFKQFADKVLGNNNRIGANLTKTQKEVDRFAQKFIQQGNSVSDAINKANEKVKQNQEKTIEGLTKKYLKLGMTIQDAYSKAQKESNNIWNGDSKPTGSNNQIKDFAQSFLSGGFGGVVGKLGLIGAGVTATVSVLKKIDGVMNTGFDALNRLSNNMFSYEGLKESLGTAMDYQSTRAKLDLFYGSKTEGENAYKLASKVALNTFADPQSLAEAMSIMKKNGINADEKDLYTYLDMVGARGEGTTGKEVGLAIEDAMNGEWERLKEYSITTTKLKKYLEELKKTDKATYKELKNTFNKQGSVTDPQKAYKLIMNYVRNSPINGYAEQYAKTAQGSVDNLKGLWEQIKVSIMGLDDASNVIEGSALFHFSDMVNNLKDTLGSESASKGFRSISQGLGEGFESFGESLKFLLENTNWEEVGQSLSRSLDYFADTIEQLSQDGTLQTFFDNFGTFVKYYVQKQSIELERNAKDLAVASDDSNLVSKAFRYTGNWMQEKRNQVYNLLAPNEYANSKNEASDSQIIEAVRRNKNLSFGETNELYRTIKSDNTTKYEINIEKIEANNFDEIMESIKQAQANRRNIP